MYKKELNIIATNPKMYLSSDSTQIGLQSHIPLLDDSLCVSQNLKICIRIAKTSRTYQNQWLDLDPMKLWTKIKTEKLWVQYFKRSMLMERLKKMRNRNRMEQVQIQYVAMSWNQYGDPYDFEILILTKGNNLTVLPMRWLDVVAMSWNQLSLSSIASFCVKIHVQCASCTKRMNK